MTDAMNSAFLEETLLNRESNSEGLKQADYAAG